MLLDKMVSNAAKLMSSKAQDWPLRLPLSQVLIICFGVS